MEEKDDKFFSPLGKEKSKLLVCNKNERKAYGEKILKKRVFFFFDPLVYIVSAVIPR